MLDKIKEFFRGRYGLDGLSNFLIFIALIFSILNAISQRPGLHRLFIFLANLLFIIVIFRAFSKDITSRYQENIRFYNLTKPLRREIDILRLRWRDRKTYRYIRCPECKKHLRLPKNLGKIKITCNHCGNVFYKRV